MDFCLICLTVICLYSFFFLILFSPSQWNEHHFIFYWPSWELLQNALLEFARVIKAQEQVVAGTVHHLTIEAIDAGKKKLYEAKVWVKPWLNFKELQEFKHAGDSPSFTPSDLGVKRGG